MPREFCNDACRRAFHAHYANQRTPPMFTMIAGVRTRVTWRQWHKIQHKCANCRRKLLTQGQHLTPLFTYPAPELPEGLRNESRTNRTPAVVVPWPTRRNTD